MQRVWEFINSGFMKHNLAAQTSGVKSVKSCFAWCKYSQRRDFLVHSQHTRKCCLVTCLAAVTAWAYQNFRDLTFRQAKIYTAWLLTDVTHDLKSLGKVQPRISHRPFINTLIIQKEQNRWSVMIRIECLHSWKAAVKDRMWFLMKKR